MNLEEVLYRHLSYLLRVYVTNLGESVGFQRLCDHVIFTGHEAPNVHST